MEKQMADKINNCDGYVYRIARNVWSQYIHKLATGRRFESIQEGMFAAQGEAFASISLYFPCCLFIFKKILMENREQGIMKFKESGWFKAAGQR